MTSRKWAWDVEYFQSHQDFSLMYSDERAEVINYTMTSDSYPYVKDPEILTIGCSFTAGVGLPFGLSWPDILKTCHGVKLNNCSIPGSGARSQVDTAFEVMEKWGVPKKIYFFPPDMERIFLPVKHAEIDQYISKDIAYNWEVEDFVDYNESNDLEIVRLENRYGKKFKVPVELAVHDSVLAIRQLSRFCRMLGIELKVSSWVTDTQRFLERNCPNEVIVLERPYGMMTTYGGNYRQFGLQDETGCSHMPVTEKQKFYWDLAEDCTHPGLHYQIHFAEHFSQMKITQDHIEKLKC